MISEANAQCFVYTGREGALSAVGHDLKLRVTRFQVSVDGDQATGSFDADSLRVMGAMHHGELNSDDISSKDRAKIEKSIQGDVLGAKKHPKIEFSGTVEIDGETMSIDGTLKLNGQSHSLSVTSKREGDTWVSRTTVDQSRWGIKPYKALLGQLRVATHVDVEIRVPTSALG